MLGQTKLRVFLQCSQTLNSNNFFVITKFKIIQQYDKNGKNCKDINFNKHNINSAD